MLLWYSLACASLIHLGLAAPATSLPTTKLTTFYRSVQSQETRQAQKMLLKIMPLGASITFGEHSTDGNGYRKALREKLITDGFDVDMVGNHPGGTMVDNQSEGYPGFTINQVHDKAKIAVPQFKPNLILVNVGLNDCFQNVDTANAGVRLHSLVDDLYRDAPNTMVILSTLLTNSDQKIRTCVEDINRQYKALSSALKKEGRRIAIADMQPPSGPALTDLAEGTHPNDQGYKKMAEVWFQWIKLVTQQGMVQAA